MILFGAFLPPTSVQLVWFISLPCRGTPDAIKGEMRGRLSVCCYWLKRFRFSGWKERKGFGFFRGVFVGGGGKIIDS